MIKTGAIFFVGLYCSISCLAEENKTIYDILGLHRAQIQTQNQSQIKPRRPASENKNQKNLCQPDNFIFHAYNQELLDEGKGFGKVPEDVADNSDYCEVLFSISNPTTYLDTVKQSDLHEANETVNWPSSDEDNHLSYFVGQNYKSLEAGNLNPKISGTIKALKLNRQKNCMNDELLLLIEAQRNTYKETRINMSQAFKRKYGKIFSLAKCPIRSE